MVIDSKETLRRLFVDLDKGLAELLAAYVVGGANLLGSGIRKWPTEDVDVISPEILPKEALQTIDKIAKKRKIPANWMNTKPAHLEHLLARGWRSRATLFFKGRYLRIWFMGRTDMIGLKLVAALERFKDRKDLLEMDPTAREWEKARKWARNYPANPGWARLVDNYVAELKKVQSRG